MLRPVQEYRRLSRELDERAASKQPRLSFGNVIDSAMFGLEIAEKYTDHAIHLLNAMGDSAKLLHSNPSYSDSRDMQFVYQEVLNRIEQVGGYNKARDQGQIWATAQSLLQSLSQPEFEDQHKD